MKVTEEDIKMLIDASDRMINTVAVGFHRYLCRQIDWNRPMLCIKGPKGTGKTTLVLQHIKEAFGAGSQKVAYFALDHILFSEHRPIDVIEYFYTHGWTHLFIDEVHHARDWSMLMKTAVDFYPGLNIVYSGSSILKLSEGQADLSRRQVVYNLKGMSFREFLEYEGVLCHDPVTLDDILKNHRGIALEISQKTKILPLFRRYLKEGYYPFYRNDPVHFADLLLEVVNNVLNVDLPAVEGVTVPTVQKARKMLMVLAKSCPQQPNMSALYRELETERNMGVRLLAALERAELLATFCEGSDKLKNLSRQSKIYLGDTNLMYAMVPHVDVGAVRETFMANQLSAAGYALKTSKQGDFVVDDLMTLEVGGSGKGFGQIADLPDSYVVSDDTEVGFGNKIPLWLFGFLY